MEFNYEEAFIKLAAKVKADPNYLSHLEKVLEPELYRGLLVWIELDKSYEILLDTDELDLNNPVHNKKVAESIRKVKSIHERAEAEIEAIAELKKKK